MRYPLSLRASERTHHRRCRRLHRCNIDIEDEHIRVLTNCRSYDVLRKSSGCNKDLHGTISIVTLMLSGCVVSRHPAPAVPCPNEFGGIRGERSRAGVSADRCGVSMVFGGRAKKTSGWVPECSSNFVYHLAYLRC